MEDPRRSSRRSYAASSSLTNQGNRARASIVFMSPAIRETTPRFFDEAERLSERFVGRG
jgi:hypothetical protein